MKKKLYKLTITACALSRQDAFRRAMFLAAECGDSGRAMDIVTTGYSLISGVSGTTTLTSS